MSDPIRSRQARELAERALVRLVDTYGTIPDLVLLGGLVPDLLCSRAEQRHVGTTDVDVQVDLEIQGGLSNASHVERALVEAGFKPDAQCVWRWKDEAAPAMVVKVEFLADLADVQDHRVVKFGGCKTLGAVNLRGTRFAAQDWELRMITADFSGVDTSIKLRVATLPAYLLAKTHAACGRSLPKDWYDLAYVLIHNDEGGPVPAAQRVRDRFGEELVGSTATALKELRANFADARAQGSLAYATTMCGLYPDLDNAVLANDAVAAVTDFMAELHPNRF